MENRIFKKIDTMGRVTIPKAIRQLCNINIGDQVEFVIKDLTTIEIRVNTLSDKSVEDTTL